MTPCECNSKGPVHVASCPLTIEKNKFFDRYAKASGLAPETLASCGFVAEPCDCDAENCDGWQMRSELLLPDPPHIPVPTPLVERLMPFQSRVAPWVFNTFGAGKASDVEERSDRFLEEALELVQSHGFTKEHAHDLVEYVFGRPVGEPYQEVGGVMVTLAALCNATSLDMHEEGEKELSRVNSKVDEIRLRNAAKTKDPSRRNAWVGRMIEQNDRADRADFISQKHRWGS